MKTKNVNTKEKGGNNDGKETKNKLHSRNV